MLDPTGFAAATSRASLLFGGLGYLAITAMVATSFDRSRPLPSPHAWRILQLTCGYYLLAQFMVSFGMRVPAMPLDVMFLLLPPAVLALRMIAMTADKPHVIRSGQKQDPKKCDPVSAFSTSSGPSVRKWPRHHGRLSR